MKAKEKAYWIGFFVGFLAVLAGIGAMIDGHDQLGIGILLAGNFVSNLITYLG